jgi:hypothetical protein
LSHKSEQSVVFENFIFEECHGTNKKAAQGMFDYLFQQLVGIGCRFGQVLAREMQGFRRGCRVSVSQ